MSVPLTSIVERLQERMSMRDDDGDGERMAMREVEVNVKHRDLFQRGARLPGGAHNNSAMSTAGSTESEG